MPDCHLILEQVLDELPLIDGIAAYSLFQLPQDPASRHDIYKKILQQEKNLYFAAEGLNVKTPEDCERIETLWRVRQTLPFCWQG
jgi:sporadic carbohydrate cluster protein (TIGR04323 family)